MKGLAITNSGDVSLLEIKELIGAVGKKEKNAVVFDCDSKKLCDLCYSGRSFSRIMELICSFEFKNLDEIRNLIPAKITADSNPILLRCRLKKF